ncbi:MAG TPA: HflX family GTPase [Candidatus Poseidoniales archaeon]|nr:MAG TPA: HflX family GTPase [Candidatus Poseidoniales archaeon]
MRMTLRSYMAQQGPDFNVLAGAGGVALGEARTNHEGRRAILLIRGNEDTTEFESLVKTMGITIVETVFQPGQPDVKGYFGIGRLQDIADELRLRVAGHPWQDIDLVLIHTNATPRQLVAVSDATNVEVWDRVRLLLSLFTAHANSLEARTQVRIARLQSDRTVLRELANQTTTGERAGYGGGGVTALQAVIANVNRELTSLRKRQIKHSKAQAERRRQRSRSGAVTVGIAGYTNAGKSSFFLKMSGKEVLVEDKLFSTLETTVGRLAASPRVLLADTIGFIDNLPNATLDAFRATLSEALECDMLLLLVDATDSLVEFDRKISATQREVNARYLGDETSSIDFNRKIMCVLTKVESLTVEQLAQKAAIVESYGYATPLGISVHQEIGLAKLQDSMLEHLFGHPVTIKLSWSDTGRNIAGYLSDVYQAGMVIDKREQENRDLLVTAWINQQSLARLVNNSGGRIEVK